VAAALNQIVRHKHQEPSHKPFFYSACDLVYCLYTATWLSPFFFVLFLLQNNFFSSLKLKTAQSRTQKAFDLCEDFVAKGESAFRLN
jgi:hypothetical protein